MQTETRFIFATTVFIVWGKVVAAIIEHLSFGRKRRWKEEKIPDRGHCVVFFFVRTQVLYEGLIKLKIKKFP